MDRTEFVDFVRARGLAVVATTGPAGSAQAALVGIAATDDAELVFDSAEDARKIANLRRDPRVTVVIGWNDEVTVQCEGTADLPTGVELARCQNAYFAQYPDGRARAAEPGIVHVRVRPAWLRHSDFRLESFGIIETRLG